MASTSFDQSIKSFVSFALAIEPELSIGDRKEDRTLSFRSGASSLRSQSGLKSIDELMAKYDEMRGFLPRGQQLESLSVHTTQPEVKFAPGVKYEVVTISSEQLELAKQLAGRLESIKSALGSAAAAEEYESLGSFLTEKRATLLGDLSRLPAFESVIGGHAVGQNGNPQAMDGGAVIFVIIEVVMI